MSSKFKRVKKNGGIEALKKRVKTPGTVDAGIIDAGQHPSGDITVAGIGFVHEFGASFTHPGGTPYVIGANGQARFVKKGTKGIAGVTKPHNITIPERSFMRSTIQAKKKDIISLQKKLLKQIVNGTMKVETGLGLVGEFMADAIKQKIVSLRTPANSAATIRKKGSSNPLIDTGQLKNSITYEVNR